MNLKEALLFVYGVIFATSTPYLKPKNRFLFPTATWKVDSDLTLFLGGSGICASLGDSLVVNTNLKAAAGQWRADLGKLGRVRAPTVVLSSMNGSFGDLDTLKAIAPSRILGHADRADELWAGVENVNEPMTLKIGDETVRLIPIFGGATESDLVVFFEKRRLMMFGALFVNRIHPHLKMGVAERAEKWIATLERLMTEFDPEVCVPGEGEVGSQDDVREFIRYLRALTDKSVEFSYCRQNFDWMEIPSATSLEENFDLLRRNVKTHTSMN